MMTAVGLPRQERQGNPEAPPTDWPGLTYYVLANPPHFRRSEIMLPRTVVTSSQVLEKCLV